MDIEKIRWQCRRGMLELDILLCSFVDKGYAVASKEQQASFVALLTHTDQELYQWLVKRVSPPPELQEIVKRILDRTWKK